MAIIAEGSVLQTIQGYKHIEECVGEQEVLTEKGFKNIIVEPIKYSGQVIEFILWGYPDWLYVSPDSIAKGIAYNKCLDKGGLGICHPFDRCWEECPDNHPNKNQFKYPKDLSILNLEKRGHVCAPTTCMMKYSHRDQKLVQDYYNSKYEEGYEFSRAYKLSPDEIPCINLKYYLNNDPTEFKAFVLGWYTGMGQTKLDLWNYFLILKNKELAYQVQFLFNYFGVPCAIEPYHSVKHGYNNWAIIWCKNKKAFHYKSFIYNQELRCQIKKTTLYSTDNELIKPMKWFTIRRGENNTSKYFSAPFYFKY